MEQRLNNFDWEFNDFGENALKIMFNKIIEYLYELEKGSERFITLSGPTEIGKTHLLKKASKFIKNSDIKFKKKTFMGRRVIFESWDETLPKLLDQTKNYLEDISNCGVFIVHEFLGFKSRNSFTDIQIELAQKVLTARAEKPMMIETNKSLRDLAEIDERVASRLKRYGSEFLEISKNIKPFHQR